MKLPFKQSPWIRVQDGYARMFVRWLYATVLDELYLPSGTSVRISEDGGRKPARPGHRDVQISATSPNRRGMQEAWFFEQSGYLYNS
ncbi:hypothetical protein C4568_03625 [Candidatus Parcubacteria bacterium]|nr:MAG: hypothetical protein C4568_03625 [Candidatus Parcubacteria bacterium]